MNSETSINYYLSEHARHINFLPGQRQSWLSEMRKQAIQNFAGSGFPTLRNEDWKYTNLASLNKQRFKLIDEQSQENNLAFKTLESFLITDLQCHRLVFINGHFTENLSQILPGEKLIIGPLSSAINDHAQQIKNYLNKIGVAENNALYDFNLAFFTEGSFVFLPANSKLTYPIHLLFVNTEQADKSLVPMRNLIVAEENSSAVIIENFVSLSGGSHFTNMITEINLQVSACIEHYKILQENLQTTHIGFTHAKQAENSCFKSQSFTFGGQLTRSDTLSHLSAEFCECHLNGLYIAKGRQHIDHHTFIDHQQPHGVSRENYKGIITDYARAVFNGKVKVHLNAQKTDAQQINKNLLLSENAEIDTKPQLEIYADDVQCAHGATVGQLDENALFYLRSRGLTHTDARYLLINAFASEQLDKITLPVLQNYLRELVSQQLNTNNL